MATTSSVARESFVQTGSARCNSDFNRPTAGLAPPAPRVSILREYNQSGHPGTGVQVPAVPGPLGNRLQERGRLMQSVCSSLSTMLWPSRDRRTVQPTGRPERKLESAISISWCNQDLRHAAQNIVFGLDFMQILFYNRTGIVRANSLPTFPDISSYNCDVKLSKCNFKR